MHSSTSRLLLPPYQFLFLVLIAVYATGVGPIVAQTIPKRLGAIPPPIAFSADPSDSEFAHCRLFAEPLLPIGGQTTPEQNKALAGVIVDFASDPSAKSLDALRGFLNAYPKSAWRVSLLVNMGIIARNGCDWSEASDDWQTAWRLGRNETEPTRRLIVDRALGELVELYARVARAKELKVLLAEVGDRNVRGPGSELLSEARERLYLEEREPEHSLRSGPIALAKVWAGLNPGQPIPEAVLSYKCSANGTSLSEVCRFARNFGMDFQMAKRSPGALVLYPCVVNWKIGHYAALTKQYDSGLYEVNDTTFDRVFSISEEILDREASGYFLVPSGDLPNGWQKVDEAEGGKVWGKGITGACLRAAPPDASHTIGCQSGRGHGTVEYRIEPSRVNLILSATPLFYASPHGARVEFTATYSQRDVAIASTPKYPNLGAKWNSNLVSFVVDDPNNVATVTYGPGGGVLRYAGYTKTGVGEGAFSPQVLTRAVLKRTSATSYIQSLSDGSRRVFDLADASTPSNIYMTEYDDPAGNAIFYKYDSTTYRLVSVVDSSGQESTLTYLSDDPTVTNGDFYRISAVTDPFGRKAMMTYDDSGRLILITDMARENSAFSYGRGDFIETLMTSHGDTKFVSSSDGADRTLLVSDTDGSSEFVKFVHDKAPPDFDCAVPSAPGFLTSPLFNQYRTTYYWSKKHYHERADLSAAHLYHYTLTSDFAAISDILESEKCARESRIYYNYPGQTNACAAGDNGVPCRTARLLEDGSTLVK